MDRHTLNTILTMHAEKDDLSRMMSTFEAAVYPLSPAKFPSRPGADQNSFFSSNTGSLPAFSKSPGEPDDLFQNSYDETTAVQGEEQSKDDLVSEQAEATPFVDLHYRPAFNLTSVNTHSFEIIIETAIRLGCTSIAIHYLRELFSAWQQERSRLREAHASLLAWKSDAKDQASEALLPLLSEVPASTVGPSIHPIYTIYNSMKYGRHERQRKYPRLAQIVQESERILAMVQEDIGFWSEVLQKKRLLQHIVDKKAKSDPDQSATASGEKEPDGVSSRTQLSLMKRNEIELDELLRRMQVKEADLLSQRLARQHIVRLSKTPNLEWLPTQAKDAERWLAEDAAKDAERVFAIEQMRTFSDVQQRERLAFAERRFVRRRTKVTEALDKARAVLAEEEQRVLDEKKRSEALADRHAFIQEEAGMAANEQGQKQQQYEMSAAPGLAFS